MMNAPTSSLATVRRIVVVLAAVAAMVLSPTVALAQEDVDDPALLEAGEAVFSSSCAGCHGADGTGSNSGRPLIGVAAEQPDRSVHIASVTMGKGGMPAFGSNLSEEEINAAVTYARLTFVAEARQELPNTGNEPVLVFVATALVALGLALRLAAWRHPLDA